MRRYLNIFLLLLLPALSFGQHETKDSVYTSVDQMPEYPGGQGSLLKYITKNLRYPIEDKDGGIQSKVIVNFVIDRYGKTRDIKVARSIGSKFEKSIIELIKNMPEWEPGKYKGKAVNVKYVLPVTVCYRDE